MSNKKNYYYYCLFTSKNKQNNKRINYLKERSGPYLLLATLNISHLGTLQFSGLVHELACIFSILASRLQVSQLLDKLLQVV
jgi:hypothetical protein